MFECWDIQRKPSGFGGIAARQAMVIWFLIVTDL